jgi:hypothetical protein
MCRYSNDRLCHLIPDGVPVQRRRISEHLEETH